jgi:hypothetical protein
VQEVICVTFADIERRMYLSGRSRVFALACYLSGRVYFVCFGRCFATGRKTSIFALYGVFPLLRVL